MENSACNVVSYGGGLNSSAMLVGLATLNFPIHLILFADTGGEKPETYAYLSYFSDWLEKHSLPRIIIVKRKPLRVKYDSLEENCLVNKTLPSLAFGFKSCSKKWKVAPQEIFTNHFPLAKETWAAGGKVTKLIGYHAGETRRAKIEEDKKYRYQYPLIEWNWDIEQCQKALREAGLDVPLKSACFFCPASTKKEIRTLHETHPELFIRAIEMEDTARPNLKSVKGLGRRFSWRDWAEDDGLDTPFDIPCDCFDG
jgi:hypothetical protein